MEFPFYEDLLISAFYQLIHNSSGATSLNYYGNCSVKIYHTCREVTTHVKTVKFEFMDGKVLSSFYEFNTNKLR